VKNATTLILLNIKILTLENYSKSETFIVNNDKSQCNVVTYLKCRKSLIITLNFIAEPAVIECLKISHDLKLRTIVSTA